MHLVRHINANRKKKKKKKFYLIYFYRTCEQNIQPGHCRFRQYGTAYLNVNHSNKSTINPTIIPVSNNINTPTNRSTDKTLS